MNDSGAEPIRILVVDDHCMVRAAIAALLKAMPGVGDVLSAQGSREAFELCASFHPHVVLLDLRMPNGDGLSALEVFHRNWPSTRVLILTGLQHPINAELARKGRAAGFLSKCESPAVLMRAIHTVAAGGTFFTRQEPEEDSPLTAREVEVVRQLSLGYTNKEIGHTLGIAAQTVKGHLKNLFPKLGAANRAEAVTRAVEIGIL